MGEIKRRPAARARKIIVWTFLILVLLSFRHPFIARSQVSCDGCVRRASIVDIFSSTSSVFQESIRNRIAEGLITSCFHLLSWIPAKDIPKELRPSYGAEQKPPEYLIRAAYIEDLRAAVTGKLKIDLYYNGPSEELVASWETESDSKITPWEACKNKMFENPGAVLKKVRPVEITVLNDFEKRPKNCEIQTGKDEVMPGEQMDVGIKNIRDIQGRASRDFNRIVVQAKDGEIIGGVGLESDPALKAFRVGSGNIRFMYRAPKERETTEDTIFFYNSCDVLREDLYPLSRTELKDKIAEKKIRIGGEADLTVTYNIDNTMTASYEEKRSSTITIHKESHYEKTNAVFLYKLQRSINDTLDDYGPVRMERYRLQSIQSSSGTGNWEIVDDIKNPSAKSGTYTETKLIGVLSSIKDPDFLSVYCDLKTGRPLKVDFVAHPPINGYFDWKGELRKTQMNVSGTKTETQNMEFKAHPHIQPWPLPRGEIEKQKKVASCDDEGNRFSGIFRWDTTAAGKFHFKGSVSWEMVRKSRK